MSVGHSRTATIVGSDKGGVGKSMVSSLLIEAYDQARRPLSVVEIDHQGKLRNSMGNRVDLSLRASPELGDITKNPRAAERFYNQVYDIWADRDSLTDLGANVTTFLFDWMRQCDIAGAAAEDQVNFRFVAVATPDDQALRSAYNAVSTVVDALGHDVEQFLVLNETAPGNGFSYYESHQAFRELNNLRDSEVNLRVVSIPYCDSHIMDFGRARSLSPLTVFKNDDRLCEELGLSRVAARTEKKRLLDWMEKIQENLEPLFAAPRAGRRDDDRRDDVRRDDARRDMRAEEAPPPYRGPSRMTDAGALVEQLRPDDDRRQPPLRPVGGLRDARG